MLIIIDTNLDCPKHCDGCFALDDDGDYPYCRITGSTQGYTFNTREKRMPSCPMNPPEDEYGRLLPTGNCQRCIYTFGTLGCCDTVNNIWHWSCTEGMRQFYEREKAGESSNVD